MTILTDEQRQDVLDRRAKGEMLKDIAALYGVTISCVKHICHRAKLTQGMATPSVCDVPPDAIKPISGNWRDDMLTCGLCGSRIDFCRFLCALHRPILCEWQSAAEYEESKKLFFEATNTTIGGDGSKNFGAATPAGVVKLTQTDIMDEGAGAIVGVIVIVDNNPHFDGAAFGKVGGK